MTYEIIALICRLGMDPSECQPPTAFDRIVLGTAPNEIRCNMDGEEHMASVAGLVPEGFWVKIMCPRREEKKL